MKKLHRKKVLRNLLICAFVGAILWLYLTPLNVKHPLEHVQVKVEQPEASAPPLTGDNLNKSQGDEKSDMDDNHVSIAPSTDRLVLPHLPKGSLKIAIIIDDVGLDLKGSQRAIHLPDFITLSFMPYATRLHEQTSEAQEHGHELMLHMPMEPLGHIDPGPGALLVGLSQDELKLRLDKALESFTGFDGVNNHMGSKFTADSDGMELVIQELKEHHVFFIDSRTSPRTVGEAIARHNGLPTLSRDVFLDDDESLPAIQRQLLQTEHVAEHKGYAVAIGHPHATTLEALENWIPEAQKRGIQFVPIHNLINLETISPN